MDLSVLIVTYNSAPSIGNCLVSLERHLANTTHEVFVIDNASSDETTDIVSREFPRVKLLSQTRNCGFAGGVNAGLQHASGRYVLWLNPDAELLDDGVGRLLAYMDEHPEVGLIGPQLLDTDGTVQLSCRSFPSLQTALFHRYAPLTRWFPRNRFSAAYLLSDWEHDHCRDVDWVSGACVLHRRSLVDAIGPLDERFFMYCEDVDFCLRTRHAGLLVRYHPMGRVRHMIGGSSRSAPRRMIVERHRSMWRYYRKHLRRTVLGDGIIAAGLWSRCALHVTLAVARGRMTRGTPNGTMKSEAGVPKTTTVRQQI